jgi:D-alanyl-D-alanine carboxypeptidase
MTERRAWSLSRRAASRAVLAALVLLAGLVAPPVGSVAAQAGPSVAVATAAPDDAVLESALQADLEAYLQANGQGEHISAAGLSVSLADRRSSIDLAAGTTTFGGTEPVCPGSVWQIGSNTKAFTSVLLLQLEAEHRLSIDDPLGRWLPEYPQWRDVSIRRLLNMTSGIPTYDDTSAWMADYIADPHRSFSPERLVGYAVGVPATSGYSYSNTNYVLAEMIVERVTGESYGRELRDRIFEPLALEDIWYRPDRYPSSVTSWEPAGYFTNSALPGSAALVGRDVSRETLSWARGAGGIISTTGDMTRWERALYSGRLLPAQQQAELASLISTRTGQPIATTTPDDPMGFGLGIAQITAPGIGTAWFYEGETLGFRTLHLFMPETGLIMAMGLNSQPVDDHIGDLVQSVYATLVAQGAVPAPAGADG